MNGKPPIVLLSNTRWDALWEWSHIMASTLADLGYPTVYVETTGIKNPHLDPTTLRKMSKRVLSARSKGKNPAAQQKNLTVYSPLAAPPTYKGFRYLNRRCFVPKIVRDLRRVAGTEPVVVAMTPTQTTQDIVSHLGAKLLWYHCVLNYEEVPGTLTDTYQIEQRLLRMADVVTVDSGFLKEKHSKIREDMIHMESGVNFELFQQAQTGPLKSPVKTVYYFGAADERRFDFALVREITRAGFVVRMLGTLSDPTFKRVPGVEYLGSVPHKNLPEYLRDADALIIPYKITAFSKGTFPAKTYESLATGKPVVATPLPDLQSLHGHIYLANGAKEFTRTLSGLHELETPEKMHARIHVARENSWAARFEKFEKILWERME